MFNELDDQCDEGKEEYEYGLQFLERGTRFCEAKVGRIHLTREKIQTLSFYC